MPIPPPGVVTLLRHATLHASPGVSGIELANTIIAALTVAAALVTVIIAARALAEAQKATALADKARKEAREAEREAARDRRRAAKQAADYQKTLELTRQRQKVERVGELVEQIFWIAHRQPAPEATDWIPDRNRLAVAMAGLASKLPECARAAEAATAMDALAAATSARQEVLRELDRLEKELGWLLSPPQIPDAAKGSLQLATEKAMRERGDID